MPKRALVTGAARRVGRAISHRLADAGYDVAIHYRGSVEEAQSLQSEILSKNRAAVLIQADLGAEDQVRRMIPHAAEAMGGPIGLVVNNASTFVEDPEPTDRETWDFHMEPNLRAPYLLAHALVAQIPAEASGAVVNLIDQRVWNLPKDFLTYTLSKSGLWTLTRTLALAFAPQVRVNAVGPGPVLPSVRQSDENFEMQVAGIPLQRSIPPEEIAEGVLFLAEAKSVTGQMIALDGGQHLNHAPPGGFGDMVE
ncbi:MAG: SDR family oxidoreductase [Alphaproteobacteria bacterium]|nr:SDR family oxidoreductase [Alphaproteobacteria bacterium]